MYSLVTIVSNTVFYNWKLLRVELKYSHHTQKKQKLTILFFFNFIYLFIYLWLCWVFVSVRGLSLVAASGGHSSSWCAGLSLSRPLLLRSPGSRRAGSVIVAHGPSCSAACGIFTDQGSNLCPLHWQADSQPLCHQGSPQLYFLMYMLIMLGLIIIPQCICIIKLYMLNICNYICQLF